MPALACHQHVGDHVQLLCSVLLDTSRQVSAASVKQDMGMDSDDEVPGLPPSPLQRRAAPDRTPTISLEDFSLAALDAVHVTCSMLPDLQMLVPAAALGLHAGAAPHCHPGFMTLDL